MCCTLESTRASQSVSRTEEFASEGRAWARDSEQERRRERRAQVSRRRRLNTLRTCSRITVAFLANQDRRPANISALGRCCFVWGRMCTRDWCTGGFESLAGGYLVGFSVGATFTAGQRRCVDEPGASLYQANASGGSAAVARTKMTIEVGSVSAALVSQSQRSLSGRNITSAV